jgi:hypothetical protein
MIKTVRWFFILGIFTSCVTTDIPTQEYTMAQAAYDAAEAHEAGKFVPQLFYKMEKSFRRAELLFKERYYDAARKEFVRSRGLAEKAEALARLKEFNAGDDSDE